MNIEVNTVTHHGAWSSGIGWLLGSCWPRCTASANCLVPGQTTPACPWTLTAPIAQSPLSPGWVIRYGIAPYSSRALVDRLHPELAQFRIGGVGPLPDEEGDADGDDRHRDHREARRRDVVLERQQGGAEAY